MWGGGSDGSESPGGGKRGGADESPMVDKFDQYGSGNNGNGSDSPFSGAFSGSGGFGDIKEGSMQDKFDDSLKPPSSLFPHSEQPVANNSDRKPVIDREQLRQQLQKQLQQQQQGVQAPPLPLSESAQMTLKVTICGINSMMYGVFGVVVGGIAGGISGYPLGNAMLHAKAGAMSTGAFFGVTNLSRCTLAAVRGKDDVFNVFISGWLGGSAGVLHTRNPRYIVMSGLGSAVLFTVFTKFL